MSDSNNSISDTVLLIPSGRRPCRDIDECARALATVCCDLAEDVVRNGEGVRHVVRTTVTGAPSEALARSLGKAVINAPRVKCAICGNDPNVGRLIKAIGKFVGVQALEVEYVSENADYRS